MSINTIHTHNYVIRLSIQYTISAISDPVQYLRICTNIILRNCKNNDFSQANRNLGLPNVLNSNLKVNTRNVGKENIGKSIATKVHEKF